jgi:redox-sensitive bicupin YhaK (pirin superfamily)
MLNTILHKAGDRGHADHGWLSSYHTFSFAGYYNPQNMNFGALRVLNDDSVSGGRGFGDHPHDNMEIISIPLDGDLEHEDSMGNKAIIRKGDIQAMSAGTGIYHSEKNAHANEVVKFLQIWIYPNQKNVQPRYDQITLDLNDRHNRLQQILSPNADDEGVWIHQNAWFHIGKFDAGASTGYTLKDSQNNGVYAFVLSGDLTIDNQQLNTRDGFGLWGTNEFTLTANTDAEVLLMEVPMKF